MSQAISRLLSKVLPPGVKLTPTLMRKIFITTVLDDEWEGGQGGAHHLPVIAAMMGNTVATWMSNYDCNGPHRNAIDMNRRCHPPPSASSSALPAPAIIYLPAAASSSAIASTSSAIVPFSPPPAVLRARRASSFSPLKEAITTETIEMDAAMAMGTKALQSKFEAIYGQITTSGNQNYLRRAVTGGLGSKKRAGHPLVHGIPKRRTAQTAAADISTWVTSYCSIQ